MSIFKCKMCGGTIEFEQGATVGVCDSCGTKQTLPKTNDAAMANLFNRANNLRLKCEFDKAEQIYEKIVQQDDSEAEAHWGIVLCKYGIEYVEDPKTFQRIPTCHRTLFDAVTSDPDYLAAIDYSDASQQSMYESEARAIDRIQRDILAIVKNEKPFDVFICYKETDESGKRTIDSTIANDIYYQLTQEGFKVFYAAITLEDKLGQEYEPYIFAALNSAKVMLVIGTKPEYFSAVWVKNEWSRFLKLMKADRSKLLIPCYRDMDAYDLPEDFAHLQAQDMSKIGFINDVVRGIKKVIQPATANTAVVTSVAAAPAHNEVAPLLKRIWLFLEDGDFAKADEFCEQVLNIEPECAEAYIGKLLSELHIHNKDQLFSANTSISSNKNYQKAMRFGDTNVKEYLESVSARIEKSINDKICEEEYRAAVKVFQSAKTKKDFEKCLEIFESISSYADSLDYVAHCKEYISNDQKRIEQAAGNIAEYVQIERQEKNIIESIDAQIKKAVEERESLGLFARKRSIEIDKTIESLASNIKKHRISYYNAIMNKALGMQVFPLSEQIAMSNAGEIVSFGSYNDEPQKWIILKAENNSVYLLSWAGVKAEDLLCNNTREYDYSNSEIHAWLNAEYLHDYFSEEDRQIITSITLADKELIKSCIPKKIDRQLWIIKGEDVFCKQWWLSDNGGFFGSASYVENTGAISDFGKPIDEKLAVRPIIIVSNN